MGSYYISVKFENNNKSYYFSCDSNAFNIGDYVVVETSIGKEIGKIVSTPQLMSSLNFDKEIKPILRRAIKSDLNLAEENKKLATTASNIFISECDKQKLNMRLISAEYTLDRQKILFTYASDDRIDFRELLKVLASALHCRIELKQITSRERAQLVGGIGVCGLPLCCSTFFTTFDGISLSRAKNQMLAINIPKLSGQCGKLLCCLKYEDDLYTELKKQFPTLNSVVKYLDEDYKVTGINIFTKVLKIENKDNVNFVTFDELNKSNKKPVERKVFQTPKNETLNKQNTNKNLNTNKGQQNLNNKNSQNSQKNSNDQNKGQQNFSKPNKFNKNKFNKNKLKNNPNKNESK